MAPSRRTLIFAAAVACTLAACDALLGLNQYQDVACAFDCGLADVAPHPDVHEAAAEVGPDVVELPDVIADTGSDARDAGDAADVFGSLGDSSVIAADALPQPTGHETWAYWPMPNPDAAVGPWDGAPMLPHTMTYDAGTDGGNLVAYDVVTGLTWQRGYDPASSLADAWNKCVGLHGAGWRVPTRIELVSLLDFTVASGQPLISASAFPGTAPLSYWTSSPVAGSDGGVWTVSFQSGLTDNTGAAVSVVRCVQGGHS
jgi:hypothetical protein